MSTTRDDVSRAGAYVASDKPLFAARKLQRNFFTGVRVQQAEESMLSPSDSLASRLPRRTSQSKPAASLRNAYQKALIEEAEEVLAENGGSPSPAPRPRPADGASQREKDERRMSRLREGMAAPKGTILGRNGITSPKNAPEHDNTIASNGSNSGGSISGSWSSVGEDAPDVDLHQGMSQTQRDQERLAAALRNQDGLFTRGAVGSRVSETARTLTRKNSGSSTENEPGVRIPNSWGSRARREKGWLTRRLVSPDSSGELPKGRSPVMSDGPIDWAEMAVDAPLPSVEEDLSIQEPTPPHSRPSSAQHGNTSPQKSQIWDVEQDFTAQSLILSTSPQLKVRNSRVDDIRSREIDLLSKRAVATSRLEEIKERNSEERSVSPEMVRALPKEMPAEVHMQRNNEINPAPKLNAALDGSGSHVVGQAKDSNQKEALSKRQDGSGASTGVISEKPVDQATATPKGKVQDETPAKEVALDTPAPPDYAYEKKILEEEGEQIAGTPITIFKGAGIKGHRREDSWETLRKLSRIASASPSPAPTAAERPSEESLKQINGLSVDFKRLSGASTPPKSDVDPEERIAAEASLFELPDNKSERNSIRTPSLERDGLERDGDVDETPRPRSDPLSMPTPIVTGAYIDTPAVRGRQPTIVEPAPSGTNKEETATGALHDEVSRLAIKDFIRGSKSRSTSSKKADRFGKEQTSSTTSKATSKRSAFQNRPRSRPPLVNTAHLFSVEDDLRRIQVEAQVEDSILDDFDAILDAEGNSPNLSPNLSPVDPPTAPLEFGLRKEEKGNPLTTKERARIREMQSFERLQKTIKSGLLNIRDAKRGIERLEDQVSSSASSSALNPEINAPAQNVGCPYCSSPSTRSPYYLTIPLPRFWYWDSSRLAGITFTWLGLVIILFLTWFFAETVTCEYICHPTYASTNNWSVHDPFWGGALPTLIDRLSGGTVGFASRHIWRFALWVFGSWMEGLVDDLGWAGESYSTGRRGTRRQLVRKPPERNWWDTGESGSMFADETI